MRLLFTSLLALFLNLSFFGQSDCGTKPIYSGDTLSVNYKSSLSYQLYERKLKTWEDCVGHQPQTNSVSDLGAFDFNSEVSVRKYLDKYAVDIEGIWEYAGSSAGTKLLFIKDDYRYIAYILEPKRGFRVGDIKAYIEPSASESVLTINFFGSRNEKDARKCAGILKSDGLIEFFLTGAGGGERMFYKVYPKLDNSKKSVKNGDWAGNGSGVIVSKSGYIITNHHVIDAADEIEVEFIIDDEVQTFNAEFIQSDKVNDLAIIKIVDVNFDGLEELPYNFKTRSSDVGTKVYAYGYPMALSIMGKEIKVTDGIISSKSGYDGDITTYQITAPIQGGNSGGPLFDDQGNFIGINSSGLRKDVADNVGYTIKSNYVISLLDVLPKTIDLPTSTKLASMPLTEQIKEITKCVVLVKVK